MPILRRTVRRPLVTPATGAMKQRIKAVRQWWNRPVTELQSATLGAAQVDLAMRYRQLISSGCLPSFREVGFRVHCDVDEDGILLYLFTLLGQHPRTLVDIGSASISASNTANLLRHHGWTGLLVDANQDSVDDARRSYASEQIFPPRLACSFVTAENVDDVLLAHGVEGDVGLLSIDIDGMDYWVWRGIGKISPWVVLIEFQDILGPDRAVTVPYSPDFRRDDYAVNQQANDYVGASLPAMIKLGREKGYRLVGVNGLGFNAFFVRNDLVPDRLPEVSAHECLVHPWNAYGQQVRYPRVAQMAWTEV